MKGLLIGEVEYIGGLPTILRFRNFRIVIYTDDHKPAHVHALGPDKRAVFNLNCWKGPVSVRERYGTNSSDESALAAFLTDHLELLCKSWEAIHGS